MKKAAQNRLRKIGLPAARNDDWIFFPVSKLSAALSEGTIAFTDSQDLVQTSGNETETILKNNLGIESEDNVAALLPLAYAASGKICRVEAGTKEKGILKSRDAFSHSQFVVENGASLELEIFGNRVEREFSAERIDIYLKENAKLNLFFHEHADSVLTHLTHLRIVVEKQALARFNLLLSGKNVSRVSADILLQGKGACADYRSLGILNEETSAHSHLRIYHNAPETFSNQFARYLLSGRAYASYDGNVLVAKHSSNAQSEQLINSMLLSQTAKISAKPVLKIYHDNVECSHGATCGSFDKDSLFYLESRGIDQMAACRLLSKSFAHETFSREIPEFSFDDKQHKEFLQFIQSSPLAERVNEEILKKLSDFDFKI